MQTVTNGYSAIGRSDLERGNPLWSCHFNVDLSGVGSGHVDTQRPEAGGLIDDLLAEGLPSKPHTELLV